MGNTNRVTRAILAEAEKVNCDEVECKDCEFEKFCRQNVEFYFDFFEPKKKRKKKDGIN